MCNYCLGYLQAKGLDLPFWMSSFESLVIGIELRSLCALGSCKVAFCESNDLWAVLVPMFIMCFLSNSFSNFCALSFWNLITKAGLECFRWEGSKFSCASISFTSFSLKVVLCFSNVVNLLEFKLFDCFINVVCDSLTRRYTFEDCLAKYGRSVAVSYDWRVFCDVLFRHSLVSEG